MRVRGVARAIAALVLAAWCFAAPAFAARPLLDQHQWDKYFALFARDTSVPWKPATVRLDTYSGAAVDLAVYNVDPADVIIAGPNAVPRPLNTKNRKPLLRWRFSPPRGYRFEANDVRVPLGSQEGFYVVEARRGDAVQQVWLNRTRIGLLAQDSPEGLVFWGVDLHSGRALAHMKLSLLVGRQLIERRTDGDGLLVWREPGRPAFALAQYGAGRAFVSLLPQPPPAPAIVAVRLDSAVVRAGSAVRFVGFARKRVGGIYRRTGGAARITVAGRGKTIATARVQLDDSGAFSGTVTIPPGVGEGDYAVLANAASGVGGTSLHVDAASDVTLAIHSTCPCDPRRDVPLTIVAQRGELPAAGVAVRTLVVRSPHVIPPGVPPGAKRWGTTVVYDRISRSDADGLLHVVLSSPSDGLDSTYTVRATTSGASATSSIVVPSASVALALDALQGRADVGAPVAFEVRGFDPTDGAAAKDLTVRVGLEHGATRQERSVTLDARGRAKVVFQKASLGSNLALAQATVDGRTALDAASVLVEPSALGGRTLSDDDDVAVVLDKSQYRPGERLTARATVPGASGDALIALTGSRTYVVRRVRSSDGRAVTTFTVGDPQGAVHVDVACVRDGAIALGSADVALDAPGHEVPTSVALDRAAYAPGESAQVTLHGGGLASPATLAIRIADARESGPAYFGDAGDVLASGATVEETPSSADPQWHAYVVPAGSHASDIFAAERARKVANEVPVIGPAAARTMYWNVERGNGATFDVPVPTAPGRYVLSVMRIAADGDVGAASARFSVR